MSWEGTQAYADDFEEEEEEPDFCKLVRLGESDGDATSLGGDGTLSIGRSREGDGELLVLDDPSQHRV